MKQTTIVYEDTEEAILALKAPDYHACLWDLAQDLRGKLKHGHTMSGDEVLEYVRSFIANNVNLNEVS
jgi:hypothetical protein